MHSSNPVHAIQGYSLQDESDESARLVPASDAAGISQLKELDVVADEEEQNETPSIDETATLVTAFEEPQAADTGAEQAEEVGKVVHENGLSNNCWDLADGPDADDSALLEGIQSQQGQQQLSTEVRVL